MGDLLCWVAPGINVFGTGLAALVAQAPARDDGIATSNADCLATAACRNFGRCAAVGGRCVVSTEGCRGAEACVFRGQCTALGDACVAANDQDCQHGLVCRNGPWCAAEYGACREPRR